MEKGMDLLLKAEILSYSRSKGLFAGLSLERTTFFKTKMQTELYKVFADSRIHLVPEKIWEDYMHVHVGLGDWEKILNKYKISFVVLSKKDNKRIIEFIGDSPGWKKVYEDEVGIIFVRK